MPVTKLLAATVGLLAAASACSSAATVHATSTPAPTAASTAAGPAASATTAASTRVTVPAPPTITVTSNATALSDARSRLATASDGTTVYAAGGLNTDRVSSAAVWAIDAGTTTASKVGTLAVAVHDAAAVWAGGRLLVIGGGTDAASDLIQSWSPTSDSKVVGHLKVARADHTAVLDGTTIYVIGGAHGTTANLDVIAIDSTTLAESRVATLPKENRYGGAVLVNHRIVLFGGEHVDGVPSADVIEIDPATGAVRPLPPLPHALSHFGIASSSGLDVLVGGTTATGSSADVLVVDPSSTTVVATATLPAALTDAGVVALGSRIVVAGGNHTDSYQRSITRLDLKV
jgi:hypothetical protein